NKYKNIPYSKSIVFDFHMGTDVRNLVPGAWHLLYDKPSHTFTIKRSDGEDQHIELSKCKFGFTIGDGDELEKLLQEAQVKMAMADIKVAEGRLEEEELKSVDREQRRKSLERKRKREEVEDLNWKITFWNEQGHMDKVNKFRQDLYALMGD